jgi:glycine oxidase
VTADLAVVGAGVIGCAIARQVAREGMSVVVVDREEPGRFASGAAAGMLAAQAEADRPDTFLSLLLRSRALYPALVEALRSETGMEVGYRARGMLILALDEEEEGSIRQRFSWQRAAGLQVERLSGEEARALEPVLSRDVRGALHFTGDHQVDSRLLTRALWLSAHAAGAVFRLGEAVSAIRYEGASFRLELEGGGDLQAERVVVAAGCWSGRLEGLPRRIPVEPVHGQLLSIEGSPPLLRHAVGARHGYLVPRGDGRIVAGTTVERIGFRSVVTLEGLKKVSEAALRMVPGLAARPVVAHWSGLRPATPDLLPILGRDPDLPSLLYATGHFRNGILLAPVTARIVADLLLERASELDLTPFRADRFEVRDPER